MRIHGPFKRKPGVQPIGLMEETEQGIERRLPTGEVPDAFQRAFEQDPIQSLGLDMSGSISFITKDQATKKFASADGNPQVKQDTNSISFQSWEQAASKFASVAGTAAGTLHEVGTDLSDLVVNSIFGLESKQDNQPRTEKEIGDKKQFIHTREWNRTLDEDQNRQEAATQESVAKAMERVSNGEMTYADLMQEMNPNVTVSIPVQRTERRAGIHEAIDVFNKRLSQKLELENQQESQELIQVNEKNAPATFMDDNKAGEHAGGHNIKSAIS